MQQLLKGCEDSSLRLRQGLLEAQFLWTRGETPGLIGWVNGFKGYKGRQLIQVAKVFEIFGILVDDLKSI